LFAQLLARDRRTAAKPHARTDDAREVTCTGRGLRGVGSPKQKADGRSRGRLRAATRAERLGGEPRVRIPHLA
jgi:hypothetical protein